MQMVGYTEEEERQVEEINGIQDREALALAKEDFEQRTGKEFPADFQPNIANIRAAMVSAQRQFEPY